MTSASGDFSYRVSEKANEVSIVIAGTIDESSDMPAPDARGRRVTIDAEGVLRINSLGVRAWIVLMEELATRTTDVVVTRLPAILVTQASMISTFLGNARVDSFKSPWVCLNCDHAEEKVHGGTDPVPESIPCPKCGQTMELDWDRASFLAFRGG